MMRVSPTGGSSREAVGTFHTGAHFRARGPYHSTFYSDRTRDPVARWYRREIKAFGFEFEDRRGVTTQITD